MTIFFQYLLEWLTTYFLVMSCFETFNMDFFDFESIFSSMFRCILTNDTKQATRVSAQQSDTSVIPLHIADGRSLCTKGRIILVILCSPKSVSILYVKFSSQNQIGQDCCNDNNLTFSFVNFLSYVRIEIKFVHLIIHSNCKSLNCVFPISCSFGKTFIAFLFEMFASILRKLA